MSFPKELESEGQGVDARRLVFAPFTDDGTPTGSPAITGDYSITPKEFWFEVPPGSTFFATTVDIYIQGPGNVTANGYGPIAALPNGLTLILRDAGGAGLVPPVTTKTTGGWHAIPGTQLDILEAGPGDNYLNVQWNFALASGTQFILKAGQRAVVVGQDNFTSLTDHKVTVSGYLLDRL